MLCLFCRRYTEALEVFRTTLIEILPEEPYGRVEDHIADDGGAQPPVAEEAASSSGVFKVNN